MMQRIPLSVLCDLVQEAVDAVFYHETFWVIAELADVKKYSSKGWCFLKLIEKRKEQIQAEMPAVIWNQAYPEIVKFEKQTGREFSEGLEVSCLVRVTYHVRYGLKAEILEIDASFTLGQMELSKQLTLQRLVQEYPEQVWIEDGEYVTANQQLELPRVIQRIALLGARNSDGYRDFMNELLHNNWGYDFFIEHFQTNVQGQHAALQIAMRLDEIRDSGIPLDLVVLVRGGGSATDLFPFDDFELARRIADMPFPVFTGIGHDRNISIADLMGWPHKTPTKVAAAILQHNRQFEESLFALAQHLQESVTELLELKRRQLREWDTQMRVFLPHRLQYIRQRLLHLNPAINAAAQRRMLAQQNQLAGIKKQVDLLAKKRLESTRNGLQHYTRLIDQLSPENIIKRGFAILKQDDEMLTSVAQADKNKNLVAVLKDGTIETTIIKTEENGERKIL